MVEAFLTSLHGYIMQTRMNPNRLTAYVTSLMLELVVLFFSTNHYAIQVKKTPTRACSIFLIAAHANKAASAAQGTIRSLA